MSSLPLHLEDPFVDNRQHGLFEAAAPFLGTAASLFVRPKFIRPTTAHKINPRQRR